MQFEISYDISLSLTKFSIDTYSIPQALEPWKNTPKMNLRGVCIFSVQPVFIETDIYQLYYRSEKSKVAKRSS